MFAGCNQPSLEATEHDTVTNMDSSMRNERLTNEDISPKDYLRKFKWQLEFIKDIDRSLYPKNQKIYIEFHFDRKRADGFSGCNYYEGILSTREQLMTIVGVRYTKKMCPFFDYETVYLENLQSINTYEVNENHLYLKKGSELMMAFLPEKKM